MSHPKEYMTVQVQADEHREQVVAVNGKPPETASPRIVLEILTDSGAASAGRRPWKIAGMTTITVQGESRVFLVLKWSGEKRHKMPSPRSPH